MADENTPDPFDTMFDDLAKLDPEARDTPAAQTEAMKAAEPAPTPTPEPVVEEPAPAAEEPAPEPVDEAEPPVEPAPAPKPEPVAAAPQPTPEEMQAYFRQIAAEEAKKALPQAPPAPEPEIYTPEEKEFLAKSMESWKDVHQAEALLRKKEYVELTKYFFSQVGEAIQALQAQIEPVKTMVETVGTRNHVDELHRAIPDYDQIRDPVVQWAAAQPEWMKPALEKVIQKGTTDEVVSLVNHWRAVTGAARPAPKPVQKTVSPEVQKAAAALAPVQSKRSAVVQAVDPSDFDGAFEEAMKARGM